MIDTSMWKEFRVGDLFDKLTLKCRKKDFNKAMDCSEEQTDEFSLPLTNAKHFNNGIQFYGRPDEWDSAEMTIDIVSNGAIATGDVYAQPQRTGVLWDSYLVKCKYEITSELVLQYMACVIQRCVKQHFGWDDKCTWDKVKEQFIKLPTTSYGQPDWAYMESYMKSIMEESEKSLENLKKADGTKHLIDVSGWGEFKVGDLFDIHPTNAYKVTNRELLSDDGYNPVVANSGFNNGIVGFTNYECNENAGAITFTDTAAKSSESFFYQTRDFVGYPHVQGMYCKSHYLNEYEGKFITTVLRSAAGKFDFIIKMTRDEVKNFIIKLPITSAGEPDWQYMEDYMKQIMEESEQIISDFQIGV